MMSAQLSPEQLQAFQQLSHSVQAQQQQIAALQQELHQLHAGSAASVVAPGSSSSIAPPSDDAHFGLNRLLSKPSLFQGEHGNRVLDWINEFDILFENCDSHMPEVRKITFAKQFLREEALRWWIAREQDVQRAIASQDASQLLLTPAITSWSQFKTALKEYFSPRGASESARNELHKLRQQQFRSLAAYADRFEATSRRIEVPPGHSIDDELVATFKSGLTDGQIRLFLTNKQPKSLFHATQLALQAESDLRVSGVHSGSGRFVLPGRIGPYNSYRGDRSYQGFRAASGQEYRSGSSPSYSGRAHTPAGHSDRSSGPAPMDLSALFLDSRSAVNESDPEAEESAESRAESDLRDAAENSDEETLESQTEALNMVQGETEEQVCQQCGCNSMKLQKRPPQSGKAGCWNCGRLGHISRDCPEPRRQLYPSSASSRPSSGPSRDRSKEATPKPRHF